MTRDQFSRIEQALKNALLLRSEPEPSGAFTQNIMREIRRERRTTGEVEASAIILRFASCSAAFAGIVLMLGVSSGLSVTDDHTDLLDLDPDTISAGDLYLGDGT